MKIKCMRSLLALTCVCFATSALAKSIEKKSNTTNKSALAIYNTTAKTSEYVRKNIASETSKETVTVDGYIRKRSSTQGNYKVQAVLQNNTSPEEKNTRKETNKNIHQPQRDTIYIYKNIETSNTDDSKIIPITTKKEKASVKEKTLPLSLFQQKSEE